MEEIWLNDIQLSLSEFNGAKFLNIRKWYFDKKDQVKKPGKQGMTINNITVIDSLVKALSDHREEIATYLGK